jgi:hypothetical protein
MTTEHTTFFIEGRYIARVFHQASDGRDSILRPSQYTIARLSRLLDLKQCYIRKCLDAFNYSV